MMAAVAYAAAAVLAVAIVAVAGWDIARRVVAIRGHRRLQELGDQVDKHEDAIRNHKAKLDQLQAHTSKQDLGKMAAGRRAG